MTRMRPHECDCSFCEVTEVPMTPEEIRAEEHWAAQEAEREEKRALNLWVPARNHFEQWTKDIEARMNLNRDLLGYRIEEAMFGGGK